MRKTLLIVISIFASFFTHSTTASAATPPNRYASGHIIVKFKPNGNANAVANDRLHLLSNNLNQVYLYSVSPGQEVNTVSALSQNSQVEYAEPDYLATATATPNDPYYALDTSGLPLWYRTQFPMNTSWDIATGSANSTIAIIDSGIQRDHPDLRGIQIAPNSIDISTNTNIIDDDFGHGTQVAGIIAAQSNNGIGIAGANWNARLLIIKANVNGGGIFNYSSLAQALAYADADPTVKVINMSMGGYADSRLLREAVSNLVLRDRAILISGIGNEGVDISSQPFYPAAYRGVISAGSTDEFKARNYNYGYPISLSAPGKRLFTTFLGGDYGYASGTSFSSAYTSGVASLLASQFPSWKASEIAQSLKLWTTCPSDQSNCQANHWSPNFGTGTINSTNSLKSKCDNNAVAIKTSIKIASPLESSTFDANQTISISGTVESTNFQQYQILWGLGNNPTTWSSQGITLPNNGSQQVSSGLIGSWNLRSAPSNGIYQLRVITKGNASCLGGRTGEERIRFSVTGVVPTPTPTPTPIPSTTPCPNPTPCPVGTKCLMVVSPCQELL